MLGIGQKKKIRWFPVSLCNGVEHFFQIGFGINRNRKDLSIGQKRIFLELLQLAELGYAVGSPISPVENQDDIFFALEA